MSDAPQVAPCARCGGATSSLAGELRCRHCGASSAAAPRGDAGVPRHELFAALRSAELGHVRELAPEAQSVSCQGCGAVTITTHRAVRCPFCGGALVASESVDGIAPDAVATFAVDEAAATAAVTRWLGRLWLAPSDVRRVARRDALQRAYLPYWSFSVVGRATYAGERGEASYRTERRVESYGRIVEHRVRHVSWKRRHGQVERELRDHLVPATSSLPPAMLTQLAPWRGAELVPFASEHLHEALAERYSVDLRTGFGAAQQELEGRLRAAACFELGGDEQRISSLRVKHEEASFRHLLLPVWSTALSYRGRSYRIAVNGQTGKLVGQRPYSRAKIGGLIAVAVVLLAAILAAIALWMRRPPPFDPDPEHPYPDDDTYVAQR